MSIQGHGMKQNLPGNIIDIKKYKNEKQQESTLQRLLEAARKLKW